ncbi:Ig-like domain-containing protein [Sphingomonas adhaesiva]|uniref:Ig-like domain-containing protein n=1 Tax=Sphingomonas adhaesiva TaxID=28212 RepID=UPI002FFCF396
MVTTPEYTRYFKLGDSDFFEDWSTTAANVAADDWSKAPYWVGYLGDVSSSTSANAVPANSTTITDLGNIDAVILGSNVASTSGGVGVFQSLADPIVALQGSGTADSPSLVLHLDATGRSGLTLSFDLRDVDSTADNASQSFAVQYRVGDGGTWTTLQYVVDASDGPSLTKSVNYSDIALPSALDGQSQIQIRFATSNATGSDEWVGVDNIRVTSVAGGVSDTVAPTLTGSTPADDAAGVATDANIVLRFSEPVYAGTGDIVLVGDNGDTRTIAVGDTGQVTISGSTVTINPAADLVGGVRYQVQVASGVLVDVAKNAYAGTAGDPIDFTVANPLQQIAIGTIQGERHVSEFVGATVLTQGVVTAIDTTGSRGFWMQDPNGDGNARTSDAIFVFTGAAPTVTVGQSVQVQGVVNEYTAGIATNLPVTQLTAPVITTLAAPLGTVTATEIGAGKLLPPTSVIENDGFSSFDPQTDGADFYEALEGMVVTIHGATAVAPSSGGSTWVIADGGIGATGVNGRGGITLTGGDIVTADFNPERIQVYVDSGVLANFSPNYVMGDRLGDVTGVIHYFGGNYELIATSIQNTTSTAIPPRETTALIGDGDHLTFAEYNIENFSAVAPQADIDQRASDIANNLKAPDIVALVEVQDNDGPGNGADLTGTASAQKLIDAIVAAGGPRYAYVEVAPTVANTNGGQNNGNIRNGFLYNTDRVGYVDGSARLVADPDLSNGDAFRNSRKPLVADFTFNGQTVTTVAVHNQARIGSDPLFGAVQPPANAGEQVRNDQSAALAAYIQKLQLADPNAKIAVAGDFNGFYFEQSLTVLEQNGSLTNLTRQLSPEERYTTIFEGNSQQLDHILASSGLAADSQFDIVHLNTGFADPVSDHDPTLARFRVDAAIVLGGGADDVGYARAARAVTVNAGAGDDAVTGSAFADTLFGGAGADRLRGGAGNDTIRGGTGADRVHGGAGNDTFVFLAGDLADPAANGGQFDHVIDFHGAGTSGTGEQDFLSFTGFGANARLEYVRDLGGNATTQIYRVVTDAGVAGQLLVQMADGTNKLTAGDYSFF